ncbi:MAG: hypothetical protein JNN28_05690 [Saprospiraceae bacterium]|nr:hypothetical protein [Saprospiraceae bacterium]
MQISTLFKWALLFLCLIFLNNSSAQTSSSFTYSIRVDEVDFLAPHGSQSNKLAIYRDYYPHPAITDIAWKYPNTQNPVAFVSGKAPKVYAKFDLAGCPQEIWAKGDGPDTFDPVVQKLGPDGSYAATPLSAPFPANKVDFYEPFDIVWYISNSPSGPWIAAGKSSNPLYITYAATPFSPQILHSVIYYGCKNAKGLTNANSIVDNIYNGTFAGRTVPRKDNPTKSAMSYWAPDEDPVQYYNGEYFYTHHLLKWENGRCGSWAYFFYDMILFQGILGAEVSEVLYLPDPTNHVDQFKFDRNKFFGAAASDVETRIAGMPVPVDINSLPRIFFVKDFDLNSNKFYKWNREWMTIPGIGTNPVTLPNGNVLNFAPKPGDSAQGNNDPMSTFQNHGIVKYNGKYYDPSYGTSITGSKNEWETNALIGFGSAGTLVYKYTYLGIPVETYIMWLSEPNNSSQQAKINP